MTKLSEFMSIYRLYRRFHSRRYCLRREWDVAIRGLPF